MPSRCLNKVVLIGNLTRDPELKYTPGGMAVCSFGLATNRSWMTKDGEKKEDAQFHRIVSWNKLAELCSQLLAKGRRIFVEGRIQYREFNDQEGNRRQMPEIVIDDMILLDNKRVDRDSGGEMVAGGGGGGAVVDDGTIEDIVIPDEVAGEVKKEESKEDLTKVVDEVIEKEVKEKEEKTAGADEEMPF